ncbi:TrbC family F-type conjugative pilus assembly protein [Vibrio cholerae]|jgi:conjugal transfer pilus assembly protein TraW|uniref:TrbC family F-type conjugative pilus assembly protein n=1 Tax=Vibrio fluvialis TaxID=676 RepID=UPI002573704B|nr:TrbC family F-type conjugative pilus assembly protein [Vibrio fluvialis]EGR4421522.1 hypothetical protein [Vibrio cholerae]BEI26508.1 hypothetical protein KKIDH5335_48400 [Vibrio fluvialis]
MVVRNILLGTLFALNTYALSADIGQSIASGQQQAIARGQAALEPSFLGQLSQEINGRIQPISAASEEIYSGGEASTSDDVVYKILISDAMGEREIKALFRDLGHRSDVAFVVRGLLPQERTINDVGMRIIQLVKGFDPVPNVQLDPRPFQAVGAEFAPQILMYQGDELIASATGLANPTYLKEQHEQGKSGNLGNFGAVVKISERDITEVIKERMDALDKDQLIAQAKDRYWNNVQFFGLPDATETQIREFEPVLTVDEDMFTPDGQLIAFKGQRFNTLNSMPFTQRLVVFDATNPDQVEFVKSLPKSSKRTKYITTRYDRSLKWDAVKHIEEQLGAPVYQLKPDIIQAFSLQVVPSVIVADNVRKVFVIEETQVGYFGEGQ